MFNIYRYNSDSRDIFFANFGYTILGSFDSKGFYMYISTIHHYASWQLKIFKAPFELMRVFSE